MSFKRFSRVQAGLLVAFILLTTSGCVYYRLYKLKAQLADFENYFTVEHTGRPTLVFKKPVIHEADVEWLTGLSPSTRHADGDGVTNVYHFTKVIASNTVPSAYHELIYTFEYEKDRLTRITLPLQYRPFLTSTNFMEMLSPIRGAETDHADKKTEWTWREMFIQIPSYERLVHYLGKPSQTSSNLVTRDPFFRYTLKGAHLNPLFEFPLRMDYRVWNYNNRMYDVSCNVGRLFVYIDVSKEDKVVKMDIRK